MSVLELHPHPRQAPRLSRGQGAEGLSRGDGCGTQGLHISRWSALPGLLLSTTALEPAWGSSPGPANRQDFNAVTVLMRTARRHSSGAGVNLSTGRAPWSNRRRRRPPSSPPSRPPRASRSTAEEGTVWTNGCAKRDESPPGLRRGRGAHTALGRITHTLQGRVRTGASGGRAGRTKANQSSGPRCAQLKSRGRFRVAHVTGKPAVLRTPPASESEGEAT